MEDEVRWGQSAEEATKRTGESWVNYVLRKKLSGDVGW